MVTTRVYGGGGGVGAGGGWHGFKSLSDCLDQRQTFWSSRYEDSIRVRSQ